MLSLETSFLKDARLGKRLDHLYRKMVHKESSIINRIYNQHKDKMGAYRFLNNDRVEESELISVLVESCKKNLSGTDHILCIEDSSEINYDGHKARLQKQGRISGVVSHHQCGTFLHPLLLVDASSRCPLGFGSVKLWNRDPGASDRFTRNYRYQAIEEKESYRWLESAMQGCQHLPADAMKTIIADREGDIFELFRRVPGENVHLLIRSTHERLSLTAGMSSPAALGKVMAESPLRSIYTFPVPHGSGRKKRDAQMELRFEQVSLQAPVNGPSRGKEPVTLYCIHVKEQQQSVPERESPIEWRLLTTHEVTTPEHAYQCLDWYRCRWFIEELFRVLKRKGFMIEDAQFETIAALQKLILISLQAALQVMVLKWTIDRQDERLPASYYFSEKERELLTIVNRNCEGNTQKQKNPYKKSTMPWAAWIMARMGGWCGYKSQAKPGYITIKEGLDRFYCQLELYQYMNENKDVYRG